MPDGTGAESTTEEPPTTEEQIDGQVSLVEVLERLPFFGDAARAAYSSGGGGEGGHFAISSLGELDALIGRWEDLVVKISSAGDKLTDAIQDVIPPAKDGPSRTEAEKTRASLEAAYEHNVVMRDYAKNYVAKLKAARSDYANTEDANTATVNNSGD